MQIGKSAVGARTELIASNFECGALGKGLITTLGVPQHALRRHPDLARGAACGFGFSLAARRERSAERISFDVNLLGGRDYARIKRPVGAKRRVLMAGAVVDRLGT